MVNIGLVPLRSRSFNAHMIDRIQMFAKHSGTCLFPGLHMLVGVMPQVTYSSRDAVGKNNTNAVVLVEFPSLPDWAITLHGQRFIYGGAYETVACQPHKQTSSRESRTSSRKRN